VVAMTVVDITGSLFTMTENGFGKRSPIDEYRMTHRGSKGVRTIVTNERNGNVVFVSQVTDDNELIITTEQGMTVRIPVRDIREQGRNTMGVRIMRLNEGDKVVSVTQVLAEPDKEKDQGESIESMPLGIVEEKTPMDEQPSEPFVKQKEPTPQTMPIPIVEKSVVSEETPLPPRKAKKTIQPKKSTVRTPKKKEKPKTIPTKKQKKLKKKPGRPTKTAVAKQKKAKKSPVKKAKPKQIKTKKAKKKPVKKRKPTIKPKKRKYA